MWFYVQLWLPLLPIAYVVSCAVDQQQSLMCGGPRRSRVFSRNERATQNQRGRCGI
jgi:hypothetical protein